MWRFLAGATIPSSVMRGFGTKPCAMQLEDSDRDLARVAVVLEDQLEAFAQRPPLDPTARLLNRPRKRPR
jgi:hypothetical protein